MNFCKADRVDINSRCLRFLILSAFLFATFPGITQTQNATSSSMLTEETWLPRQTIRTILQDSAGNMWIGTNAGLYKYNLSTVFNYNFSQKTTGRLVNNTIHTLAEDAKGNMLVGTESGIALLNPTSGNLIVLSSSDETILEISKDRSGTFWVLNSAGDVFRISNDVTSLKAKSLVAFARLADYAEMAGKRVTTISALKDGNLLIGTTAGLFVLFVETRKIKLILPDENITRLYIDDSDRLFVGTAGSGIKTMHFDSTGKLAISASYFKHSYITGILRVDQDRLAVTTTQSVGFLTRGKESSTDNGNGINTDIFREGSLTTSFMDRTGNIWLGSKRGLYKLKRQTLDVSFLHLAGTPALYKSVSDIWYDGDKCVFALNASNKIVRRNIISGKVSEVSFPFSSVYRMRPASNGKMVIAADRKLIEVRREDLYGEVVKDFRLLYQNEASVEINDFREVLPGEWWISSWDGGLLRMVQGSHVIPSSSYALAKKEFPAGTHLFSILPDSNGNVWIATRGEGLLKVDLSGNIIKHYRKDQGVSNRLICLKQDSRGNIWIGSRGDGLFLYVPQQDGFRQFTTAAGLPSNTVCSVIETSDGSIWASTLNGLARYGTTQMMPFLSFGAEDGINNPENNFNVAAADSKGAGYFGNGNGIYRVKEVAVRQTIKFPVVFTQFDLLTRVGEQKFTTNDTTGGLLAKIVSSTKPIELSSNESNVRIGFAALDFTNPEKNRYAYRLLGRDTSWQFSEGIKQSVQFFDLPPGSYTFQVKSITPSSDWTIEAGQLSFIIQPTFWKSRNGYILYVVVFVITLLVSLILFRRWKRLNMELEEEKQTAQLHTQQMVFYTDLSHEIKNRLSLILGPLEEALAGKRVNEKILNNLYDQAQRLKRLTDQIMTIRKGESGYFMLNVEEENISNSIKKLCHESEPLAVVKGITLKFSSLQENVKGWCDEELLEIIVLNLLNNAIKYCRVNGHVDVKTEMQYLGANDLSDRKQPEGNYLLCTISDTGIGIPEEDIRKVLQPFYRASNTKFNRKDLSGTGIGLDLVARLVDVHHGWLDIRSELNVCTTISFYLPADKMHYGLNELKPSVAHAPIVLPADRPIHFETEKLILPPEEKKAAVKVSSEQWNILVVDDSDEVRRMLEEILAVDFIVHTATNGLEGLKVLRESDIELIISDLSMPLMDGLAFCREVRLDKSTAGLPFIILTGRNSEDQKLVCFQNEVDDFIEKPFSPELLRWRVKSLLRKASSKQQAKIKSVVVVEPKQEIIESAEDKFIQSIINLIEENLDKDYLNVDYLAESLFMSRATFYRKMEEMVGESPSMFIRKYRLKKAALLLKSGNYLVSEIASKTGFADARYFSKCFQKEFGITPSAFAEKEWNN